jgi:hypothetical protein
MRISRLVHTLEHVFPLAIENASSSLQILASEELCQCQSSRLGRSWCDGLADTRRWAPHHLLRMGMGVRMVMVMRARRSSLRHLAALLLSLHPAHHHGSLLSLLLKGLEELWNGHASLLGVLGKPALDCLDLFGRGTLARLEGSAAWSNDNLRATLRATLGASARSGGRRRRSHDVRSMN